MWVQEGAWTEALTLILCLETAATQHITGTHIHQPTDSLSLPTPTSTPKPKIFHTNITTTPPTTTITFATLPLSTTWLQHHQR